MMTERRPTTAEDIIRLSHDKFRWKTSGDVDRVEALFDDELVFVHITGRVTTKRDWIGQMRSGAFVYTRITPQEMSAKVYGEAAALFGVATFEVRIGGQPASFRLAFTEVYALKSGEWRLVNLHTTAC